MIRGNVKTSGLQAIFSFFICVVSLLYYSIKSLVDPYNLEFSTLCMLQLYYKTVLKIILGFTKLSSSKKGK